MNGKQNHVTYALYIYSVLTIYYALFCFTDIETFLIYNKVNKLCLQASIAQSVRTATCHQDNELQKFRWITDHQLMSVRLNLCLGVPLKEDHAVITLYPCNQTSELQWWECRNESLLAIQGEDLFFSPGNEEHDNVLLKKGLSAKNKWKIYGATDVLCSRGYEGTENWFIHLCTNFFVSIRVFWIFGSDYSDFFGDHQNFRKSVYWGS